MEKTLKVIRELKKNEVIKDYDIGGGIAALSYVSLYQKYRRFRGRYYGKSG